MYKILKRLLDLMGSAIIIIFCLPTFIIISICIKLTSKGPILFSQTRLGENAKPFRFYKFRTMYVDNDRIYDQEFVKNLIDGKYGKIGEDPTYKLKNDPRVTPFGRFLRVTSPKISAIRIIDHSWPRSFENNCR
jgi:lipopolysaccharide/colanic/teichoic acid biosynthesis glycosyltransferase